MRALSVQNVVSLPQENWQELALAPKCEGMNEIIEFYQKTEGFQTPFGVGTV